MDLRTLLAQHETEGNGFNKPKTFSLKDDRDSAVVRILVDSHEDLSKFVKEVHMLKIGKYPNKVACLGANCECCKAGVPKTLKMFLPLYNTKTGQVEVWERGINMIKDVMAMVDKYGDLNKLAFEITRHGKAGSKDTKYTMMYDPTTIETDATNEQAPNLIGRDFKLILGLSPEQQSEAILTGNVDWKKKTTEVESTF